MKKNLREKFVFICYKNYIYILYKYLRIKREKIKENKRKSRKNNKRGGGRWITIGNELVNDNVCPICLEKFRDTPNKAIYMSTCGHLFHNDCLLLECENKNGYA